MRSEAGAGEEVVEREHGVGLAAPEVRLKLDDRVAAPAREAATALPSSRLSPSVRNVLRKNSLGSRYSSEPSPL